MRKLDIKYSSVDKSAPPDVQVIIRLTGEPAGRSRIPPSLGDFDTIEAARERSAELRGQGVRHDYLTWWRKDGRRVNKWGTLLAGKRRYYKVSLPHVQGLTDDMVKTLLRRAVLTMADKPAAYTDEEVKVNIDAIANRAELTDTFTLRLPPDAAAKALAMPPEQLAALVARALDGDDLPAASLL